MNIQQVKDILVKMPELKDFDWHKMNEDGTSVSAFMPMKNENFKDSERMNTY